MEMIVRLAQSKYIETKQLTSISEAVQSILNDNMEQILD